jgi:hypothetical protein
MVEFINDELEIEVNCTAMHGCEIVEVASL